MWGGVPLPPGKGLKIGHGPRRKNEFSLEMACVLEFRAVFFSVLTP